MCTILRQKNPQSFHSTLSLSNRDSSRKFHMKKFQSWLKNLCNTCFVLFPKPDLILIPLDQLWIQYHLSCYPFLFSILTSGRLHLPSRSNLLVKTAKSQKLAGGRPSQAFHTKGKVVSTVPCQTAPIQRI